MPKKRVMPIIRLSTDERGPNGVTVYRGPRGRFVVRTPHKASVIDDWIARRMEPPVTAGRP